jgi:hypothetical protein
MLDHYYWDRDTGLLGECPEEGRAHVENGGWLPVVTVVT